VIKVDLEKESNDLWLSMSRQGSRQESAMARAGNHPISAWAPDGSRVAYVGLRQGAYGLYQKPSNGEGTEELLSKVMHRSS
jgi:hypothetical protein